MWVLFGVLPAVALMLVGVGVFGPRWLAIAVAVSICVPFGMEYGWPDWFWQLDAMHGAPKPWLWWLLLFGGVIGSLYDRRWLPRQLGFGCEVVLVALLPWLLSAPLRDDWSFEASAAFLAAGWVVQAAIWWSLRRAASAREGMAVPLAMTIVLGVDAWFLRENCGGADWKLAGVAAIALGFSVLTTCWVRPFVCGTGGVLLITLAHTGLLLCGRSERELLQVPLVLAWCAPLPMLIGATSWFKDARTSGAVLGVVGVGTIATCVVFAT